ncbi:GNAT family N-acetyltransferase [Microbacterium sp. bgisy189]|uniref:GNAT family N-acetyltransferase n=1 Tax=Microbacterium sp. bgisy189 TaxID=3413798 RepID=UPI003EBE87DA
MEPVMLRTARLELSIPTGTDVEAITAAAQDPEVPRWTTLPSPYKRTDAEDFVRLSRSWWDENSEYTWAVRAGGQWIGMLGLHTHKSRPSHRDHAGGAAEIGYWMALQARGRGYLTEAAHAVVAWGFSAEGLGLARIEWRAIAGNIPSARAARALGFRYEGLLRQGLSDPRGRHDGWITGVLATDDRTRQPWSVLED